MDVNRRNVLAGLYAAGIAGGLAFGSGAFASVEAERAVEVNVATDGEDAGAVSIFGRFVEGGDEGTSEFVIDEETLENENAEGVNVAAETTFEDVFRLRIESGSQGPYDVTFDDATPENGDDSEAGLIRNAGEVGIQFAPNDDSEGTFENGNAGSPFEIAEYPVELTDVEVGEDVILDVEIAAPADFEQTLEGVLGITIESAD